MITDRKLSSLMLILSTLILFSIFFLSTASASPVSSEVVSTPFTCENWSDEQYPLINLFGTKYVPLFSNGDPIWKSHSNKLAKLVLDSKELYTFKTGDNFDLGQGYNLQTKQIDVDGNRAWFELDKDGKYVDEKIVILDTDHSWTCTLDKIQNINNVPVLRIHVKQIFQGAVDSVAQIDGIWLIDYSNSMTLNINDKFGEFTLTNINDGVNASNLGSLVFESTTEVTSNITAATNMENTSAVESRVDVAPTETSTITDTTSTPATEAAPEITPMVGTTSTLATEEKQGQFIFPPIETMKVGVPVFVKAYITENTSKEILNSIENNNNLSSSKITVTPTMIVLLEEKEAGAFNIVNITPEIQNVGSGITEWNWQVTPNRAGHQSLELHAYKINCNSYRTVKEVTQQDIEVEINPLYSLEANFQWILVGVIIPIIVGIIGRIGK